MTTLTLDTAARLAEAGLKAAAAIDTRMNIAIVDAAGYLLHFIRMDDALLGSIDLALRKAKTCILFRMPSHALGEISRPDGPVYGIEWSNGGLISFVGGLPISDAEGRVIGAVGVSGGRGDEDVVVAEACLAAL
ncbi:heme-binding protein [Nocardia sp. NPDC051030]|uniref:GlcG/HbpS family heme-binding protein n=1 Tax=Nocardia sp. NPDC051030 TaxID=3155162 RepID=UPI00344A8E06